MTPSPSAQLGRIASVQLIVGLEVHVELATRSKMFTRAPNPAHADFDEAQPNTLTDPLVLALPGTLPVMNKAAVEMSALVGLALGCQIAERSVWDRKSYFYPDLPKAYQISQYDQPLCFDGVVDVPAMDDAGFVLPDEPSARVGIIRAHLEEDAGKLLHEAPGGARIDHSIVDLNRAGTPLLEIVTAPDLRTVESAVAFCRLLHTTCRFLGVTRGIMQKGHMRFEPNINCVLTLDDGHQVRTPIVEIKNLNSFRAVAGAIRYELREQPRRWAETGEEHGPSMKSTRGWDDAAERTVLQRSKEDALDYRYFPDPDLVPVQIDAEWLARIREQLPELPAARYRRYRDEFGLADRDAQQIAFERSSADLLDASVAAAIERSVGKTEAARLIGHLITQTLARIANERGAEPSAFVLSPASVAAIAAMRHEVATSAQAADRIVEHMLDHPSDTDARTYAEGEGLLQISDTGALETWADEVITAFPDIAQQIRDGKQQAIGRLIGEVMKHSAGQADAKAVRDILLSKLGS